MRKRQDDDGKRRRVRSEQARSPAPSFTGGGVKKAWALAAAKAEAVRAAAEATQAGAAGGGPCLACLSPA